MRPTICSNGGESLDIVLTGDDFPKVVARVSFYVKGRVAEIELSTHYQMTGQDKQMQFSPRTNKTFSSELDEAKQLEKSLNNDITNRPARAAKLQQKLLDTQAKLARMNALATLCTAAQGAEKIFFRVFIAADDQEIVITAAKPETSGP